MTVPLVSSTWDSASALRWDRTSFPSSATTSRNFTCRGGWVCRGMLGYVGVDGCLRLFEVWFRRKKKKKKKKKEEERRRKKKKEEERRRKRGKGKGSM